MQQILTSVYVTADPPVCGLRNHLIYEVEVGEAVELECGMEANPATGLTFTWSANTSRAAALLEVAI